MIQEDQNQMCSNSSGGDESGSIVTRSSSSASKKLKQKKVPQRGLGVAQLERIRMEEQQKKDGYPNNNNSSTTSNNINNNNSSTLLSSTNSSSSSQNATIIIPKLTNFPHTTTTTNQKPSSKPCLPYSPPPPPMPANLSPQNPIFRACPLPNTENLNFNLDSIPCLNNPINGTGTGDGFQVRWPSISVHGNVSFPKMWHPISPHHHDHNNNNKGENLNSVFGPNLSLPTYERTSNSNSNSNSNVVAPLPADVVLPRTTPQLQPPPSNSLVNNNVCSMNNNLSSSSVLNFPMEPPSNQSFYGSYSSLLWPDHDEKMMAGMKRTCPFPIDNPPIPKFHSKYAPVVNNLLSRSEESTSGGSNGGTAYSNLDPGIPIFRDMPSCPSALPEPANSRKISRSSENGNSHAQEFLTLMTPPTITSSSNSNPNSRLKQFCKLDGLPYQVSVEDPVMESTRKEGPSQRPSLLSFFPPTKLQATTTAAAAANNHDSCNSEVGESIDLNLRL